ncbi:MAG TPA: hypothetical protein VMS17_23160 [Gemmataceae bacterium]|nr:hypothetical protein [Gemmataceae bacterium]
MARNVLMEEFHVSILVPSNLPAAEDDAIRRTLNNAGFRAALRRAAEQTVRQFPSLDKARVRLSR